MEDFLKYTKKTIEEDNVEELVSIYTEYQAENWPWEYIYQKLYLHACLKKKPQTKHWLEEIFSKFDPIQQIALRQMFSYGKYLFLKAK